MPDRVRGHERCVQAERTKRNMLIGAAAEEEEILEPARKSHWVQTKPCLCEASNHWAPRIVLDRILAGHAAEAAVGCAATGVRRGPTIHERLERRGPHARRHERTQTAENTLKARYSVALQDRYVPAVQPAAQVPVEGQRLRRAEQKSCLFLPSIPRGRYR